MSCNSDDSQKIKGQSLDHPNRNNTNRGYFPRFRMSGNSFNRQNIRYPAYATGGMPEGRQEESDSDKTMNAKTMAAQPGPLGEGSESGSFLSDERIIPRGRRYDLPQPPPPPVPEPAQFNFLQTINADINETSTAMKIPFQNNTLYCGDMILHELGDTKIRLNSRGLYQVVYTLEVQCPAGTAQISGYEAFLSQGEVPVIGSRISIPNLSELETYTIMGIAYVYVQRSHADAAVELNITPREDMEASPITAVSATISSTLL
ncbi:MAG: hypothetical protein E7256_16730 [Lachnospiraceae bacterium]|nr:hypothetical protein [Lachnospiraceae bacterium]